MLLATPYPVKAGVKFRGHTILFISRGRIKSDLPNDYKYFLIFWSENEGHISKIGKIL
jgi:hypothetical protein